MEYLHYVYKGGCLDHCTTWSNAGTLNWLHRLIKQKYILDKAKVTSAVVPLEDAFGPPWMVLYTHLESRHRPS
jgi:hypothetical protein